MTCAQETVQDTRTRLFAHKKRARLTCFLAQVYLNTSFLHRIEGSSNLRNKIRRQKFARVSFTSFSSVCHQHQSDQTCPIRYR